MLEQKLQIQQKNRRQAAAQLLLSVLEETLTPRQALNQWPAAIEEEDLSLKAAYNALWHFEADEDQQQSIPFYIDTQLELLTQIAKYLAVGRDLPTHLIAGYRAENTTRFYNEGRLLWQPFYALAKHWKQFWELWHYTRQRLQLKNMGSIPSQQVRKTARGSNTL